MAETPAELALETLKTLIFTVYYLLEAFILLFIPWSWRMKDITEDTVLVTGAGSGIGRLMAIKFAKKGAKLVLWDINETAIEETATEIKKYGGRVFTYKCDLSKRDEIYTVAEKVKQDGLDVTILVNNAGIVTGKKYLDCPDNMIEKTMAVNSMAHFWTVKAFLPSMLRKNHGHIVSIASSAGLVGVTGLADYCASKFAAVGFDESLKYELNAMGKDGVHTTVVCPYYINTGMFEGVKTRFPKVLPIVNQDYAASRIVDAVLINQEIVYIPRVLYFFLALKGLIPVKVGLLLAQAFGINNCMDDFKGRAKKD
ncbi:epidermal retinol dehydrogenase 2 isoform X1 [Lingula anatina]|uniref:Epidermal retinol dehydrogenase 2 isoform X1 n=2 Tax=Lingula anatina TaxID=7574 RepID=A0A1S3H788_LINAN|nr:epidermal retinol dehydrogenase 2 isoform X1 [Lingula anatina]|eukprot:XP_013380984.1 epidermal retinol dehydrogenase 2 isoform X1 [Lingula anatina]